MTIEQLFHVEDFLNINRCKNVHVAIEAESTIEEAFGKTYTPNMDEVKVKGLYIVIFPEDDDDARDNPYTWQHLRYCLFLLIIYILISKIIELWQ